MTRWIIGWQPIRWRCRWYGFGLEPYTWRPIYATPHPQHIRIDWPATSPRWWMLTFLLLIWLANWISVEFRP